MYARASVITMQVYKLTQVVRKYATGFAFYSLHSDDIVVFIELLVINF